MGKGRAGGCGGAGGGGAGGPSKGQRLDGSASTAAAAAKPPADGSQARTARPGRPASSATPGHSRPPPVTPSASQCWQVQRSIPSNFLSPGRPLGMVRIPGPAHPLAKEPL